MGSEIEEMYFSHLAISPNPSAGTFNVAFMETGTKEVALFNAQGQEVWRNTLEGKEGVISEEALTAGLYILHATCNGVTKTAKVTIVK